MWIVYQQLLPNLVTPANLLNTTFCFIIQVTDKNTNKPELHHRPWSTLLVTGCQLGTEPLSTTLWACQPSHFSIHPMVWSSSPYLFSFQLRALVPETLLKARPPPSPHSHNQSLHYRRQSGWLFLITSLSCLSLEMGSKRRSCTLVFAGTEVSQQLTVFQILFFAILEHDCNFCFFHSSQFFTDNTQEPCNHSSQQGNSSSQLCQHL